MNADELPLAGIRVIEHVPTPNPPPDLLHADDGRLAYVRQCGVSQERFRSGATISLFGGVDVNYRDSQSS